MKTMPALALVSMTLFCAGCMPPAPKRADALSLLSGQGRNRDLKRLRLAMLFSENTRNAAEYLQKAMGSATGKWGGINDGAFFQAINGVLEKSFASVVPVNSL